MVVLSDPAISDEDWSLTITGVHNGYTLKGRNEFGKLIIQVIEEDEKDELRAHESLLQQVMEYFSFSGTKHDMERLRIIRERQNIPKQKIQKISEK